MSPQAGKGHFGLESRGSISSLSPRKQFHNVNPTKKELMRQRPMSILIFGILNLGYALLNLGGPLLAKVMASVKMPANSPVAAMKADPAYMAWINFNMAVGVVLGLALLTFGIGLLLMKNWARIGSIIYAVVAIVFVLFGSVVSWPFTKRMMEQTPGVPPGMMAKFAIIGLVFGIIFGMAYPVLLLFFMTRPNVIEACQPEQPAIPV
jgi:hypothetical protein